MKNKLDVKRVQEYIDQGLIKAKRYTYNPFSKTFFEHETGRYAVLNYTIKTQFGRLWDDLTLRCRGLVVNMDDGTIINDVYPKFFNHFEPESGEISGYGWITEKFDGSMVSVCNHDSKLFVASRSTLNNYVTDLARDLIEKNNYEFYEGYTYLFELIHSSDPHIVKYDFDDLVLLGIRENNEPAFHTIKLFHDWKGRKVTLEKIDDVQKFISEVINSKPVENKILKEGYVVQLIGKKIKVKYDQYMTVHKMVSDMSPKFIFETISLRPFGDWMTYDFVDRVCVDILNMYNEFPDEHYKSLEEIVTFLHKRYRSTYENAIDTYEAILSHSKFTWGQIMKELQEVAPWTIPIIVAHVKYPENLDRLHQAVLRVVKNEFDKSVLSQLKLGKFFKV